ncbi:unnamed protein product, partial [Choristocarpus tenellus]
RHLALAFRNLAADPKFAEIIVEGGAVEGVIKLSQVTDNATRLSCAICLCHLIHFAVQLDELIERGVVGPLVKLAETGDSKTAECCAAALYLLFCRPLVTKKIDTREVTRALLNLCRVSNTSTRKRCVAAFWNLTNLELQSAKGAKSASESIPVLLELLQTETDLDLKADCAAALYNLAQCPENCQAMILAGAVQPIIILGKTGSFETKMQCMSILQRMLLGRAIPEEVSMFRPWPHT